eukprot:jgi/Mesen1/2258/ME000153S01485
MAFGDSGREDEVSCPSKSALYVWGYNVRGQTSHPAGMSGDSRTWRCQRLPLPVPEDKFRDREKKLVSLVDMACGLQHTAAVGADGSLFTWGSNEYGQLGDGSEDDRREPCRVTTLKDEHVKAVACGAHCTAAITRQRSASSGSTEAVADGRLWVWGQNQGSNRPQLLRSAFSSKAIVKAVSCGASHAAAVSADGLLQTWGYNEWGQLGRGFCCEGLQKPGLVAAYARFLQEAPARVPVRHVVCGDYHTAAVSTSGELYTWGLGRDGQLGHRCQVAGAGETLPRRVVALEGFQIVEIACGRVHTCAVTAEGALYMWGGGREGQLGLGHPKEALPPGSGLTNKIDDSFFQHLPMMIMPSGVAAVTCGQAHTLAATSAGRLLGWGYNSCGQAATGRAPFAWQPTHIDWCVGEVAKLAAGGGHSAVLTRACTLKELCEFRLAEHVTPQSVPHIEDAAGRERVALKEDPDLEGDDEDRRRRPCLRVQQRTGLVH